ncbi:MAG: hypothetical protein N2112_04145 [Gemmataceae bacterium]|nr:hypothetical protein [Gemmataceae bacterium]
MFEFNLGHNSTGSYCGLHGSVVGFVSIHMSLVLAPDTLFDSSVPHLSDDELALLRSTLCDPMQVVSWDEVRLVLKSMDLPMNLTSRNWEELCWLVLCREKKLLQEEDEVILEALHYEDERSVEFVRRLENWLEQIGVPFGFQPARSSVPLEQSPPEQSQEEPLTQWNRAIRERMLSVAFLLGIGLAVLSILMAIFGGFK